MGGESCQHLRGLFNRLTPRTVAPGEGPTRKHPFADTSFLSPNMEVAPNEPGGWGAEGGGHSVSIGEIHIPAPQPHGHQLVPFPNITMPISSRCGSAMPGVLPRDWVT